MTGAILVRLIIAATMKLAQDGSTWSVPSQTVGGRKYPDYLETTLN